MSRSWKDIKAELDALDQADGRDVEADKAEARSRTNAYILGYQLAQLRKRKGLSQSAVAERMGISQPRVSKLEKGDLAQMEVDTLRRYVDAIGGHLRIMADFDNDKSVSISETERSLAGV